MKHKEPIQLEACPFCGEYSFEETQVDWPAIDSDVAIRCVNCGAQGPPCGPGKSDLAEKLWNDRKPAKDHEPSSVTHPDAEFPYAENH